MIAIIKQVGGEITGWILATDIHDAKRQAQASFQQDLAEELYRRELEPAPGKHQLLSGHIMLVS